MSGRRSMFEWAKTYVGDPDSWQTRGLVVRDILRAEGLQPDHRVLELGCGCLSSGLPLMRFLEPGCYVGMEPNGWLVEAAIGEFNLEPFVTEKQARFLWRSDFDASELGERFDFAVAHSILSHAAGWQLPLMLANVRRVLKPGGMLLASLRIGDCDTSSADWVYPGVSFFTKRTVREAAATHGMGVDFVRAYREQMVAVAPNDFHDWARFTRIPWTRSDFVRFSEDELLEMTAQDLLELGAGRMVEVLEP